MLSNSIIEILRTLVCTALSDALHGREIQITRYSEPELQIKAGCFVTLKTRGELRGCLGRFTSDLPLYQTVSIMTHQSALDDPRFAGHRLTLQDLPSLDFDISILSPLIPCTEPRSIVLGEDGIYVKRQGRSGCFLPQVARETGWTIEEFWGHCCTQKAGLPQNAWLLEDTEKFTFRAEIIEGHAIADTGSH